MLKSEKVVNKKRKTGIFMLIQVMLLFIFISNNKVVYAVDDISVFEESDVLPGEDNVSTDDIIVTSFDSLYDGSICNDADLESVSENVIKEDECN